MECSTEREYTIFNLVVCGTRTSFQYIDIYFTVTFAVFLGFRQRNTTFMFFVGLQSQKHCARRIGSSSIALYGDYLARRVSRLKLQRHCCASPQKTVPIDRALKRKVNLSRQSPKQKRELRALMNPQNPVLQYLCNETEQRHAFLTNHSVFVVDLVIVPPVSGVRYATQSSLIARLRGSIEAHIDLEQAGSRCILNVGPANSAQGLSPDVLVQPLSAPTCSCNWETKPCGR